VAPTRRTTRPPPTSPTFVGSVDLSKVSEIGDEGDPRALVLVGRGVRREPRHARD